MTQGQLDLTALEYRLRQCEARVDEAEDAARDLEEAIRTLAVDLAGRSSAEQCDTPIALTVLGCSGLAVEGAFVQSYSPVSGALLSGDVTAADGTATVCGTLDEGSAIVQVMAPGYATKAVSVGLPASPASLTLSPLTGYPFPPAVSIGAPPVGGGQAAGYARLTSAGYLQDVVLTSRGGGYLGPPAVDFSDDGSGTGGKGAAYAAMGLLTGLTVTAGGSNYTRGITVSFAAGGRVATATVGQDANGQLTGVTITDGGDGYSSPPQVTFVITGTIVSNPYRIATGRARIANGQVVGVDIIDPGAFLNLGGPPATYNRIAVTFTGGRGSGAAATALVGSGALTGFVITNPGFGYIQPPTVVLTNGSGGFGTGATATATVDAGQVGAIVITDSGRTYACISDCGPQIFDGIFTDPAGVVSRFSSLVPGVFGGTVNKDYVGPTNSGSYVCSTNFLTAKYLVKWLLGLGGNASIQAANPTGGQVLSCSVTTPGYGYFAGSPPLVSFVGGGGTGAAGHAVVDASTGAITGIVMDNVGSGYTSRPAAGIDPTPRPEPELSVRGVTCSGVPRFFGTAFGGITPDIVATVRPSLITCSPPVWEYDFAGTTADGTILSSTTCKIEAKQ